MSCVSHVKLIGRYCKISLLQFHKFSQDIYLVNPKSGDKRHKNNHTGKPIARDKALFSSEKC